MKFSVWLIRGAAAVLLCTGLNGCFPPGQGQFEEEKESYYLAGKRCAGGMDYPGAIQAFEKATEVNPRSASAHLQLGMLYEEKAPDAAAAIYHYEQYLKLRPDPDKVEWLKQRINNCKLDLAKTVMPLPIPAGMQREFERLGDENKKLRDQNNDLTEKLKMLTTIRAQVPATNPPQQPLTRPVQNTPPPSVTNPSRALPASSRTPTVSTRKHVVQPGETLVSIARKHGIKLEALLNANSGIDPKKVRAGKSLNLPPG